MTVLVVDDETDVQLLFEQKFRKERKAGLIQFHFAFSGEAALAYLQEEDIVDLVLILADINMPGMSGLELLRRTKERFAHLRVFMITAYGDEQNYRKAMEYGAADYIAKPIDFDDLKRKIVGVQGTR
ncbi:MAG: response regulator [Acidobacteria bacterium]|nr:response regulator [Acidobacteriota bacterium]